MVGLARAGPASGCDGRAAVRPRTHSRATVQKYEQEANRIAATPFGQRKASSLVRADVEAYLDTIPTVPMRDYITRLIRAAFRWGVDEEVRPDVFLIERDPTRKLRELEPGKKRRTWHTDDELRAVWRGVEMLGIVKATYVRLLMLLALRRGEAYRARWEDIDLDGRTWTIPTQNRKIRGDRKHLVPDLVVPLPDLAVEMLRDLKRFAPSRPFRVSLSALAGNIKTASGVPTVHPHSLRATVAKRLEDEGFPPHVVGLVLGRAPKVYESSDLHYVSGQRPAEVRRALEWWAAYLVNKV